MQSGCSYKTLNCYESETAFEAIIRVSRTFRFLRVSSPPHPALPCLALPCPALPCPGALLPAAFDGSFLLFFHARAFQRHRATENKVFLRFSAAPSRAPSPPLPSPSSRHSLPTRIYEPARYQSPREVFKRRERGAAATRELLERNTPREAANQTTRQESRPLKRVVFHTPPVTD